MKTLLIVLSLLGAEPETFKYRVTGLYDPSREAELKETVSKIEGIALVAVDFDTSEITLSYDQAKVFQKSKPKEVLERLENLFRKNSGHTFGIRPVCATPKEKLVRVEIGVLGLDCKGCVLSLYESVSKIDGVEQATASFKESKLTALIDPEKTNKAALEEALKKRTVTLKNPPPEEKKH
jgi:copper chaperone CopZ